MQQRTGAMRPAGQSGGKTKGLPPPNPGRTQQQGSVSRVAAAAWKQRGSGTAGQQQQQASIRSWLIPPCQVTMINRALKSQERMQTTFSLRPGGSMAVPLGVLTTADFIGALQACLATASPAELPADQRCIMPGQILVDRLESSSPGGPFYSIMVTGSEQQTAIIKAHTMQRGGALGLRLGTRPQAAMLCDRNPRDPWYLIGLRITGGETCFPPEVK
jgi:hypothetical protein